MGFFDRFADKKPAGQPTPAAPVTSVPTAPAAAPISAGGVLPQLAAAREKLKAKDLPGALAAYESILTTAADRSDVLMTISADLGTNGHVREIIELLAPRYDVQKHGAAAGLNLLQAYIVVRNADAAQHLLDLLFSLQRPELEARLVGFSNAVSELFLSETEEVNAPAVPAAQAKVDIASISKPIWFYGLEAHAPRLLANKEGKLRRVAFAQLSLPGLPDAVARATQPEDALGRWCRGLPLWFAETFMAGAAYEPIAAVGVSSAKHYALFPSEWVAENIRQLSESVQGGLDYVLTGSLRSRNDDFELTMRIWEVKKFRELKAFSTRWNPASADEELKKFHDLVRTYMEWTALPAGHGLPYSSPASPSTHVHGLAATLTGFFGEKGVLAPEQLALGAGFQLQAAQANPDDARAQINLVSALLRAKQLGLPDEPAALAVARAWLATEAASAAGLGAVEV
ncbi:hypothetical protein [Oleiharenicola lentus]|uniref:hypothetical protein n=1 Tax=Oleiharenicola lentus TaxID=2508720 RepID=UPI003F67E477